MVDSLPAHLQLSLREPLEALQFRLEDEVQDVEGERGLLHAGHVPLDVKVPQVPGPAPVLHAGRRRKGTKRHRSALSHTACGRVTRLRVMPGEESNLARSSYY